MLCDRRQDGLALGLVKRFLGKKRPQLLAWPPSVVALCPCGPEDVVTHLNRVEGWANQREQRLSNTPFFPHYICGILLVYSPQPNPSRTAQLLPCSHDDETSSRVSS